MECFLPICLLTHEDDFQCRQRIFFGTMGSAYVNRTDFKDAVVDSWRGLRMAVRNSKNSLEKNESFFSCISVDDQAEGLRRNQLGLSVLHHALHGVDIDVLVPKTSSFIDTRLDTLLAFKHFENSSPKHIVCSNIIDPPFHMDGFTSTYVKTEKSGFVTLFFSAFEHPSPSKMPMYDLQTLIESRVKPAQQEYHPHLTIIKSISSKIGVGPITFDSPLVDILIVEVANMENVEFTQGNFTTIVYLPRSAARAVYVDWDGRSHRIINHKVIDITSLALPIWSIFSNDPEGHELSNHLLFPGEKINLEIESSSREEIRTSTAFFFAQALFNSGLFNSDFALFSPSWILQNALPLRETTDVWRAYVGPRRLCYCEAYGASVWKFLNQTVSSRETQDQYQSSGLGYVYDKSMYKSGTLLTNVTVWCHSQWKQISRDDFLRFVIPCDSNLSESGIISSVFDFSVPAIAHNYLLSQQFKWTSKGGHVTSSTGRNPFLLAPKSMEDCPIMWKWANDKQDCVPCAKGFHQLEPGKDYCIPNPPSIFDNPRLLSLIAFSTSFILLCALSGILSWKFYVLQRKRAQYLTEASVAEKGAQYIANLDFSNSHHLTSSIHCSPLKTSLAGLLSIVEHTWNAFPHAVRLGYKEFFGEPEIPDIVASKPINMWTKCARWCTFMLSGKCCARESQKDTVPKGCGNEPVFTSKLIHRSLAIIDLTLSSTADTSYVPEMRQKIIFELYPIVLSAAEAHHNALLSVTPFGFRLVVNAFTHVESHIDSARRCGIELLHSMRTKAQLFSSSNISWLLLIHGGDGSAEIAGGDEFRIPHVFGTFVQEADELLDINRLFAGKLLWTSYIHEKSRGILFDRVIRGLSLRDNSCILIYEIIESLDFMPLQEYNQAIVHLMHGEHDEAGKSLESYMASNKEARKDSVCSELLAIARVEGAFVQSVTGWHVVKKM